MNGQGVTFSWDLNTGTLIAILIQIIFVTVFLVRTGWKADSALEAAAEARRLVVELQKKFADQQSSLDMAMEAKASAKEAHEKIEIQQVAFMMFREHVATEYVDRADLREMEKRLTEAINRLGDRFDHSLTARAKS